jgi:hypothetical protein
VARGEHRVLQRRHRDRLAEQQWHGRHLAIQRNTPVAETAFAQNPGPDWRLVSVDHFTPDGHANLLFQNTNGTMGLWELNGTSIVSEMGLPNPGAGMQSENGHPFTNAASPNGNGNGGTNGAQANNPNGALASDANATMRQSTPDAANAASVLNGSDPGTGTFRVSAPDLSNTGVGFTGVPGSPVFGAAAMADSQNMLAGSDPNLLQRLHLASG